jgi:hypothetical protein
VEAGGWKTLGIRMLAAYFAVHASVFALSGLSLPNEMGVVPSSAMMMQFGLALCSMMLSHGLWFSRRWAWAGSALWSMALILLGIALWLWAAQPPPAWTIALILAYVACVLFLAHPAVRAVFKPRGRTMRGFFER